MCGQLHPSLELCVQYSEDGKHIRKWSREPFEGGECLYAISPEAAARHRTEVVKPLVEALKAARPFVDPYTYPGTAADVREQIDAALRSAQQ